MTKQLILVPGLFALGIAAGVAIMYDRNRELSQQPLVEQQATAALQPETSEYPLANAFVVAQTTDSDRIQALEKQLVLLSERIEELEQLVTDEQDGTDHAGATALPNPSKVDTPVSTSSPAVTTDSLVRAGINEELAVEIVRRRNEIDMSILELRDRASREGYLNSGRFTSEMNALREQDTSLREDIGDDYYDSYLFASGQSNRVRVVSVMMGSEAEMAGMKDGDLVMNYDNSRVFSWSELQQATSQGERGEYVNVTVLRNGQQLNLWIPRGPLGIRLGTARVKPD